MLSPDKTIEELNKVVPPFKLQKQLSEHLFENDNHTHHVHDHGDHIHIHQAHTHSHDHGSGGALITTIGLIVHSMADGFSLGAAFFCNIRFLFSSI